MQSNLEAAVGSDALTDAVAKVGHCSTAVGESACYQPVISCTIVHEYFFSVFAFEIDHLGCVRSILATAIGRVCSLPSSM